MQYRVLGKTGLRVSVLSFGASPLGGVFGHVDESEGIRAVHRAVDLGMNFFDVSPFYGLTKAETVLGKGLSTLPRDKFILATKVGRYGEREFDFSAGRVTRSVDESLKRLQVDVIDIIQCHDIEFGDLDQVVNETVPALRRLQQAGKVRFVGITGLPLEIFRYVLDRAEIDTILSYCRYTLFDTALADLLPYLKQKNVGVINASPLSMGLLGGRALPDWHPAPPDIRAACEKAAQYCRERGQNISRLALQFALAHPDMATTLVGTGKVKHLEDNVEWTDQPLDEKLVAEVQQILAPIRDKTWPSGRPENN